MPSCRALDQSTGDQLKYILEVNKYCFLLFSLELDLAHPVLPLQSSYKVMSTKIEIKLKKAEGEKCVY